MKNELLELSRKRLSECDLDDLLQEISVMQCSDMMGDFAVGSDMYNLNRILSNWFAVCSDMGIIAYFSSESDALAFRLDYINSILNK